MKGKVANT